MKDIEARFGVNMDTLWYVVRRDLAVCPHCGDKAMNEIVGHGKCLKCGGPEQQKNNEDL